MASEPFTGCAIFFTSTCQIEKKEKKSTDETWMGQSLRVWFKVQTWNEDENLKGKRLKGHWERRSTVTPNGGKLQRQGVSLIVLCPPRFPVGHTTSKKPTARSLKDPRVSLVKPWSTWYPYVANFGKQNSRWLLLFLLRFFLCVVCWREGRRRGRVYVLNAPLYVDSNVPVHAGTTPACGNTCVRGAGTHGDVWNLHTGFFSVSRNTPPQPQRHTTTATHTTTTTTTHTQKTTTKTKTQTKTKTKTTTTTTNLRLNLTQHWKTHQVWTRQGLTDWLLSSFSVWWCKAVLSWCSDFLVNSVCARDLSRPNSVKHDSSLTSFSASWEVNSFFSFCELYVLWGYSFQFWIFWIIYLCS